MHEMLDKKNGELITRPLTKKEEKYYARLDKRAKKKNERYAKRNKKKNIVYQFKITDFDNEFKTKNSKKVKKQLKKAFGFEEPLVVLNDTENNNQKKIKKLSKYVNSNNVYYRDKQGRLNKAYSFYEINEANALKKKEEKMKKEALKQRKQQKKIDREIKSLKRWSKRQNKKEERKKRNMKYKTKQILKTILFATLGVGAVVGTASLISNVVEHYDTDLKTIHPNFSVGGLNEVGKAEKNEFAIYTKDLIEFRQLSLELDLDSEVDVDIFMYDEHGKYLSTIEMSELTYETDYTYNPKYCRLMITAPVEDDQIEWTEVYKYSSQLNVKVDNKLHEKELTFYKNGSEFFTITYCEGMTWADFVDSKYDNVRNVDFMLDGEEDVSVLVYVTDRTGEHAYELSLPEDDVWDFSDITDEERYVLSALD